MTSIGHIAITLAVLFASFGIFGVCHAQDPGHDNSGYAEAVVTSVTPADKTFDHDVEYINLNGYGFAKNMTTDWLQVKIELNLYILVPNATPRWQPVLYTLMTDPDAESANDIFTAGQLKKMTAPTGLLPHPANNNLSLRLR